MFVFGGVAGTTPTTRYESQAGATGPQTSFSASDWRFGTASHNAGTGVAWANIGNILTENSQYAYVQASGYEMTSKYAVADGFGFSIPIDMAITGIQVSLKGYSYTPRGGSTVERCYIEKGGEISESQCRIVNFGHSNGWVTVGGPMDTWGLSWTASDINSNNFGAGLVAILFPGSLNAVRVYLDCIKIKVYYAPPTIDHPDDITYPVGDTGEYNITWHPSDPNATTFAVTQNGVNVQSGAWNSGDAIIQNVGGLPFGIYTYVCTVYNTYGQQSRDNVLVNVTDSVPTIDHPDDISYAGGTTNNSITWHPHDNNPRDYAVTKDGSTVQSGSWTSDSPITVNVDGCSIDPHTYKCAVYDNYGQQASDEVVVNVYSATTVDILNIPSHYELYDSVLIIAQVTGPRASVVYQIDNDSGPQYAMSQVGSTDKYQATWNTNGYNGMHELHVKALDAWNNELARSSVLPTVLTEYKYKLFIEIDYISGYAPTQAVLDYMKNYWKAHGINVTFRVDQNGNGIVDPTPDDGGITPADFWKIENSSNDKWMFDDRAFGNSSNAKYDSKEKWILYGSWAAYDNGTRIPNIGGGTYGSPLYGNYMFIAEAMIKNWEQQSNIPSNGGEEVVLMHESGHAIGITWVDHHDKEVYDSDHYSVMSLMSLENAKLVAGYWYYSALYWSYADLAYYKPD